METQQNSSNSLLKYAATYGLVLGLLLLLLVTIEYINVSFGAVVLIGILKCILIIGGMIFFTCMYRNKCLEGYMSYGLAFVFGVLLFFFAFLVQDIFVYFLSTVYDPHYAENKMSVMVGFLAKRGTPEQQLDAIMEEARVSITPVKLIINLIVFTIIFGTIASLLTSIFARKQKSIF